MARFRCDRPLDDRLVDFVSESFTEGGVTRTIYRKGSGPAVVVMTEIPGITPQVANFARRVAAIGCTAVMPSLFGDDGRVAVPANSARVSAHRVATIGRLCISREFTIFATGQSSPAVRWLRGLARHEHERCGGPGVGAIGMCFSGGFALSMAIDETILAPVLAQPGLPVALGRRRAHSIDISDADIKKVQSRCAAGLQVMGVRFEGDKMSPPARFTYLRQQLGEAFLAIELPDDSALPGTGMAPHSPLTVHLIDEPDEPTQRALTEVLDFFARKLLG